MREFKKRNPNLKVFNAVMHLDESTPHLHIDFVPVAYKGQRGLSLKNSMSGALREQGFSSSNKMQNEWTAWSESERSFMEQILLKHGLRREDKNVHRPHLSVDDYKKAAHEAEQINKLNAHINELKKKPVEELTPEEVTLIKNQNDFMRGEIINRNETISELSKQVNAEFVSVSIYSPDKLQYIADGLARAKIPCVAESNTLYIPDYALKTAQAIASHYKPDEKAPTIREQIKLDIDRLVYRTETLDDLLYRLQERGYEIKYGKYISVKHPSAERFVRLKSLGDEYLPKNLEQRIAEKDMFTDRLFTKWNGEEMNNQTPYGWLKEFCEKNDLPFYGLHSFRHFAASALISAGLDVTTVSGALGHSCQTTTLNVYCHQFQNAQARVAEAMDGAFGFLDRRKLEA